ncbi:serine/threonine protein phosphatase, partial [Streptomyces sp. NPDC058398]
MTEHPTSHERRQSGAGRPPAPADPRGALLRTSEPPSPLPGSGALPVQARTGDAPRGSGASKPRGKRGKAGGQVSADVGASASSGTDVP